jgi:hypothetical protein
VELRRIKVRAEGANPRLRGMNSPAATSGWTSLLAAVGMLAGCGGSIAATTAQADASADVAVVFDASQDAPGESDAGCPRFEASVAADASDDADPCFESTWFGPPQSPCPNGVSCLVAWSQDGGIAPIYSINEATGSVRVPLAVTEAYVLTEVDLSPPDAAIQCQLLEIPLDGSEPVVLETRGYPWSFYATAADDGFLYYASGAAAETETGVAIPAQFALERVPSGALSHAPTVLATSTLVGDLDLVVDSGHLYVGGPLGILRVSTTGGPPEPIVTAPVDDSWDLTQKMAVGGGSLFYVTSADAGPAASVFRTDVEGATPPVALTAPGSTSDPFLLAAGACPSLFVSGQSVQRFAPDGTPLGTVVPPVVSVHDPPITFQTMALLGNHLFVQQECRYTDPGPVIDVRDVDLTTGRSVLLSNEPGWPFLPGNLLAPHNEAGTTFYFAD